MFGFLSRALARLSLALKQPLTAFCDLETTHGDAFVTRAGHYASWIRVDGMQRMCDRTDFAGIAEAMRLDLSGALDTRGHAIVGWYISDPDSARVEIEKLSLASCRAVALEAGLTLDAILDERARLVADLGDKFVMVLRNHGMLTCGRSVAEAFKLMHNLERSYRAQLAIQASNAEISPLSESIARKTAGQYARFYDSIEIDRQPDTEWAAFKRMLDRTDPDFTN